MTKLSWQDWDPRSWEDVWIYRRHFSLPAAARGRRVFAEFDGVMTAATPHINGQPLPEHLGGYLPFRREITNSLAHGDNVLAVAVDSRWLNVPPDGSPKGRISVDYLEPGGIVRPARLLILPQIFLSDVFAKPVNVLDAARAVEVTCAVDAASADASPVEVRTELLDGARTVATARQPVRLEKAGQTEVTLTLSKLGNIWGVRVNESRSDVPLYKRTSQLARELDGTRPTSGSMTSNTMRTLEDWHEDVFALDDYHAEPDGSVGIHPPLPGVPYMLAETVGQFNYSARKGFDSKYLRTADVATQTSQALRHAQAHDRARAYPRMCGVIAWCAFDYASLVNSYHAVKTPGVADVFRVPKLGAAFYQSQTSPAVRPVILPDFYWDFGPQTPGGPGKRAAIFSNCDRLEVHIDGKHVATTQPDRAGFPHLLYPPFFCDLTADGSAHPELRIDGYVGDKLALSRSFSSDRSKDQFVAAADDAELIGDGADATRLVFHVVDRYGAPRLPAGGDVTLEISGPGTIVGDNPFRLTDSGGGVGAVWILTKPGGTGRIRVNATHSTLGRRSVEIRVRRP